MNEAKPPEAGTSDVVMNPAGTVRMPVPVSKLDSFITPTENVYVIAHMGIARLKAETWELRVEGAVEKPLRFTYDSLRALPTREEPAVIECFGNPLEPTIPTRRVGNVVWLGVPLRDVLNAAGVRPHATCVWLEAKDHGTFGNVHSDRYIKDIPLAKALAPEVLLAYGMNGEPLSAEHGFPVRAVVPGYFGTNSVKWLSGIYLASTRPESLFTTRLYNRKVERDGNTSLEPVRDLDVHSVIVRPSAGDVLNTGTRTIMGWAWSVHEITRVEVSTDGGRAWTDAQVGPRSGHYTWQQFSLEWQSPDPGEHVLLCRATDAKGRAQPALSGRNRVHSLKVTIG